MAVGVPSTVAERIPLSLRSNPKLQGAEALQKAPLSDGAFFFDTGLAYTRLVPTRDNDLLGGRASIVF